MSVEEPLHRSTSTRYPRSCGLHFNVSSLFSVCKANTWLCLSRRRHLVVIYGIRTTFHFHLTTISYVWNPNFTTSCWASPSASDPGWRQHVLFVQQCFCRPAFLRYSPWHLQSEPSKREHQSRSSVRTATW